MTLSGWLDLKKKKKKERKNLKIFWKKVKL